MAELLATGGSDLAGIAVSAEGTTFIASRGSGVILAREGASRPFSGVRITFYMLGL